MASGPAVRGFALNRNDGLPPLPGSLHTNRKLSQWIHFNRNERTVSIFTGKVEIGQGILGALAIIAAEELGLPLACICMIPASTARGPDEGVTSGSLSIQHSGTAVRHACAQARELAQGRDYWSELGDKVLDIDISASAVPKSTANYTLIGKPGSRRPDLPDKVFGAPRFIHDMRVDGMLHGRVLRPPSASAQLLSCDAQSVRGLPGVVDVVVDGRFVAVLAETEIGAAGAADALRAQVRWSETPQLPDEAGLAQFLRTAEVTRTTVHETPGNAADAQPNARHHSAQYLKRYLAHASIGPSCALAQWNGASLEVWSHSQGIHNLRDDICLALGQSVRPVAKAHIAIHHVEGAGCYGHNGADDVAFDAVLLAMAAPGGRAVRVQWTRADELACSPAGPAHLVQLTATTDATGQLCEWQHELWSNGYSSRPGRATSPTLLAAAHRACGTPAPIAINAPLAGGGGADRNSIPAYTIPAVKVVNNRLMTMPIRTSAMRALGAYANVFAIESFIDEIAAQHGIDPIEYRRRHLHDARVLAVMDGVLSNSSWWHTPKDRRPEGSGHGFALARYKHTSGLCAVAARVEAGEHLRVLEVDIAVDVGQAIDPDGVRNQVEGGAIQAVSWTLKEQLRFDHTRITSDQWSSYPILRFSEVPRVNITLIDRPEEDSLGAGELAQGPVAAAIANALFDAIGVRVRTLPLSKENIVAAMA